MGAFPLKSLIMITCTKFGCIINDWRIRDKLFQRKYSKKKQVGVWNSPVSCGNPFPLIWCSISKDKDVSGQGGSDPVPGKFLAGKQI